MVAYQFNPTNTPPVAADQSVTIDQDTSTNITLSATDAENNPLTFSKVSDPAYGSLSDFDPVAGTVTYTPNAGSTNDDSFTFKANDRRADSDIATVTIHVSGGPEIQITLEQPPADDTYAITSTPAMPTIQARTKVINVTPDPTATTKFQWTASLIINRKTPGGDGCSGTCPDGEEIEYEDDIVQNATTMGEAVFTLKLRSLTAFRGGDLKLTATATVNGNQLTGETPDGLSIKGQNPQRTDIQTAIDGAVSSSGSSGLSADALRDALKRIACQESCGEQIQFLPDSGGGVGMPLLACDNGIGIFQVTTTTTCPDPFVDCPDVLFSWRANVQEGVRTFVREKVGIARRYPARLRRNRDYRNFIANVINPQRIANGLKPITGAPAPPFTTVGLLGANPPNQLLEDAVRGYNGFAGALTLGGMAIKDSGGNPVVLHEFIPDRNFLATVPDSQLSTLATNPLVWRRVLFSERPNGSGAPGDPDYVDNVKARSPLCSQ